MKTIYYFALSLLIIVVLSNSITTTASAATSLIPTNAFLAKQSGPDYGNSYGNSLKIDPYHTRLFVTGSTYGNFWSDSINGESDADVQEYELSSNSRCFLGIYDWSARVWLAKKTFRSKNPSKIKKINESCHKIEIVNNGTKVLLLGYTHNDGILDDLMGLSSSVLTPSRQYGMVLDIDITNAEINNDQRLKVNLIGGQLLQDGPIQYPIDMALVPKNIDSVNNHDTNANDLFVVSMLSYDHTSNEKQNARVVAYPNPHHSEAQLLHPNYNEKTLFRYGAKSSLLAERFSYIERQQQQQLIDTYKDVWSEVYSSDEMQDTVDIVGVIPDFFSSDGNIIVIGNTAQTGFIYGNPSSSTTPPVNNRDGFITKLDQTHGKLVQEERDGKLEEATLRIESEDYQDDEINGYCYDKENLYLVGTTMGKMTGTDNNQNNKINNGHPHAFIVAVDLRTFRVKWTTQVSGTSIVHGIACAVSPELDNSSNEEQRILHWGGNVYDGGSILLDRLDSDNSKITKMMQPAGGHDIFISHLSTIDGTINHLQQWGTNHDDTLADIQSDSNGNIVVMGNTNGGIFHHPVKVQLCNTTENSGPRVTQYDGNGIDILTDVFFFSLDRNLYNLQNILNEVRNNEEEESYIMNLGELCEDEAKLFDEDDELYYSEDDDEGDDAAYAENEIDDEYHSGSDDGYDEGDTENEGDDEYFIEFDDGVDEGDEGDDEYFIEFDDGVDEGDDEYYIEFDDDNDDYSSEISNTITSSSDSEYSSSVDNENVPEDKINEEKATEGDDEYYVEFDDDDSSREYSDSIDNENVPEDKISEEKETEGDDEYYVEFDDDDSSREYSDSIDNEKVLDDKINEEKNEDAIKPSSHNEENKESDNGEDDNTSELQESVSVNTKKSKRHMTPTQIILLTFLAFFILYACCMWSSGNSKGPYDLPTDKKDVIKYLNDFDNNDIDLRHSATGGWHGAFQSDLAEGINTMDPNAGLFPGWRGSSMKPTSLSNFSSHSINKNSQKYGKLISFSDDSEQSKQKSFRDYDDNDTTEQDISTKGESSVSYMYDGFEDDFDDDDDDDKSWMVEDRLVEDYYLNDNDNLIQNNNSSGADEEAGSLLGNELVGDII